MTIAHHGPNALRRRELGASLEGRRASSGGALNRRLAWAALNRISSRGWTVLQRLHGRGARVDSRLTAQGAIRPRERGLARGGTDLSARRSPFLYALFRGGIP